MSITTNGGIPVENDPTATNNTAAAASGGSAVMNGFGIVAMVLLGIQIVYGIAVCAVYLFSRRSAGKMQLNRKRVLVVGGSTGIGYDAAREFAKSGAIVIISARREDVLKTAAKEISLAAIGGEGNRALRRGAFAPNAALPCQYITMDVTASEADLKTKLADVIAMFKDTEANMIGQQQHHQREDSAIDVLVCCAGLSHPSRFHDCPAELASRVFNVNYFGVTNVIRASLPGMFDRFSNNTDNTSKPLSSTAATISRIVIVSSMAAQAPVAGFTTYAPSKAALVAFAHSLDMECWCKGVRCQLVLPPDVETPGFEEENKVKSEECRRICAAGGGTPFSSADMGKALVDGVKSGSEFMITLGFDGFFLARVCSGMQAPWGFVSYFTEAMGVASLGRVVAAGYSAVHYGIVKAVHSNEKRDAKRSSSPTRN